MQVNGAAARLVHRGDTIIVISYAQLRRRPSWSATSLASSTWRRNTNRIITVDDAVATLLVLAAASTGVREEAHMSSQPDVQAHQTPPTLPMTLPLLAEKKRLGDPIVMVTAYDYPAPAPPRRPASTWCWSATPPPPPCSATTRPRRSLADMLVLAAAARRGLRTPLLIGDLPFGSYEISDEQAITTACGWSRRPAATWSSWRAAAPPP